MSKRLYSITLPILVSICGDEIEITANISYQLYVGCPASMDGPAEDATVEIMDVNLLADVTVFGSQKTRPFVPQEWLTDFIRKSKGVEEALLEDAAEREAEHLDRVADARRQRREDERAMGAS